MLEMAYYVYTVSLQLRLSFTFCHVSAYEEGKLPAEALRLCLFFAASLCNGFGNFMSC